jgi:hypothetical protein
VSRTHCLTSMEPRRSMSTSCNKEKGFMTLKWITPCGKHIEETKAEMTYLFPGGGYSSQPRHPLQTATP